jgi:hypothetical protein
MICLLPTQRPARNEVPVIVELRSYRGVSCARCGEPIPVPAKVVSLQDEIALGETNAPCAFAARCQISVNESVYEIGDVQRFDGEPPRRRKRMAGAQVA